MHGGAFFVSVVVMLTIVIRGVAIAACVTILRQLRQWKFDYLVGTAVVVSVAYQFFTVGSLIAELFGDIDVYGYALRLGREHLPNMLYATFGLLLLGILYRLLDQRKAGEAELLSGEKKWHQVVEAAPIGVFVCDGIDSQRTYINPVLAEMLGCSATTFVGHEWLNPVFEEDKVRITALVNKSDTEAPVHFEFRYRNSESKTCWAHLIASQVFPASKNQTRWVGMVTDITEEKLSEAALAEDWNSLEELVGKTTAELDRANTSLRKEITARTEVATALRDTNSTLHALMQHVPDSVFTVNRQGAVLFVNRALQPCGRSVEVGSHFLRYLPKEMHTWYSESLERAFTRKEGSLIDDVAIGASYWQMRLVPIQEDGAVQSCLVICTETTRRKRAEEKLRLRDAELAHASRVNTVGEMMAGVTHEIAQPLAAISNYSAVLANTLSRNGDPEVCHLDLIQESNKRIKEQADRAASIIAGFRSFVSNSSPEMSVVDLHALVHEAVELIRVTTQDSGVFIQLILSAERSQVRVNSTEVTQVIVNLLRNACEAVAPLPVEDRKVSLSTAVDGEEIVLSVTDRGQGISGDTAKKMYEPFFTTNPKGMGMGLAICRTIVSRHDGQLCHVADMPRGATFNVVLPLAKEGE